MDGSARSIKTKGRLMIGHGMSGEFHDNICLR